MEMYAAFVIGLLGGAAYLAGLHLVRLLQVDDPVHVTAVHLLPGIWGAIAPGIFATPVSGQKSWLSAAEPALL